MVSRVGSGLGGIGLNFGFLLTFFKQICRSKICSVSDHSEKQWRMKNNISYAAVMGFKGIFLGPKKTVAKTNASLGGLHSTEVAFALPTHHPGFDSWRSQIVAEISQLLREKVDSCSNPSSTS